MASGRQYRFWIREAFTPKTLPMARLADYMSDLAEMLGEDAHVHFVKLDEGSVALVHEVDEPFAVRVEERARSIGTGTAPARAMSAYRRVNNRLRDDKGVGELQDDTGAKVISFPGREAAEAVAFGAFNQAGTLDGRLIRLGGTDEVVPIHLEAAGRIYSTCKAKRSLAKELGRYMFDYDLRLHGEGRWLRTEVGEWELQRFAVTHFEVLDDQPLSAAVARILDIPGSDWPNVDDPWAFLRHLREDDGAT